MKKPYNHYLGMSAEEIKKSINNYYNSTGKADNRNSKKIVKKTKKLFFWKKK